jgi:predicted transcriptional regulator
MPDTEPLILDLLEWLDKEPRRYPEVMEAWRTSCPRLTVWEDSVDRGFVVRESKGGQEAFVQLTDRGREFLRRSGR